MRIMSVFKKLFANKIANKMSKSKHNKQDEELVLKLEAISNMLIKKSTYLHEKIIQETKQAIINGTMRRKGLYVKR